MGIEFGQFKEWDNGMGLDFCLFDFEKHRQLHNFVKDLNHFYLKHSEFYEVDYSWDGFNWIVPDDNVQNVVAFIRRNKKGEEIVCVINFSPTPRENYKIGVKPGTYEEIFNSSKTEYGGKEILNGKLKAKSGEMHNEKNYIELTLPSYGAVFMKKKSSKRKEK